jgi:hypothetical protein
MVTGRRDRGPAEKHRRNERSSRLDPAASGLVAKPAAPKTKYRSYFEFVQNKDKKKKKLEYTITTNTVPPPGYEYVPVGDPELTSACKELSREKDAMIFMVSVRRPCPHLSAPTARLSIPLLRMPKAPSMKTTLPTTFIASVTISGTTLPRKLEQAFRGTQHWCRRQRIACQNRFQSRKGNTTNRSTLLFATCSRAFHTPIAASSLSMPLVEFVHFHTLTTTQSTWTRR